MAAARHAAMALPLPRLSARRALPPLTTRRAVARAQCILSYIEFMTRFALTFASLTGEALCESGRTFLGHTQRHGLLKVVVIDYVSAPPSARAAAFRHT